LLLALVAAGCSSAASANGPPQINYGRDMCIECGMIIDDARFAAAYRLADGTEMAFDDLGGLIIHGRDSGELDEATELWVSDFDDEMLIDAMSAFFVPTLGVASPMGHGILAFAAHDRAMEAAAELGGEVIDWETVIALPVMEGMVGDHRHGDSETEDPMEVHDGIDEDG
jgi:copper chaperone NosL